MVEYAGVVLSRHAASVRRSTQAFSASYLSTQGTLVPNPNKSGDRRDCQASSVALAFPIIGIRKQVSMNQDLILPQLKEKGLPQSKEKESRKTTIGGSLKKNSGYGRAVYSFSAESLAH